MTLVAWVFIIVGALAVYSLAVVAVFEVLAVFFRWREQRRRQHWQETWGR